MWAASAISGTAPNCRWRASVVAINVLVFLPSDLLCSLINWAVGKSSGRGASPSHFFLKRGSLLFLPLKISLCFGFFFGWVGGMGLVCVFFIYNDEKKKETII